MSTVIKSPEVAARILQASPEEAEKLARAFETRRGLLLVEGLVRARVQKIILAGPAGAGKTSAAQALAAWLPEGLDVLDVDHDTSDSGHDKWRMWTVERLPLSAADGSAAAMRKAGKAAYDAVFSSLHAASAEALGALRDGTSSGVACDAMSTLVDALMSAASAQIDADLGADATEKERMGMERVKSQLYGASNLVAQQVFTAAEAGMWTAAPGPVIGLGIIHARPKNNEKREFVCWELSMGTSTAAALRRIPDFFLAVGMDPSDRPDAKRLRYYAHADESQHPVAKARWSKGPDGKPDPDETGPALKALKNLDLPGFVQAVWGHRRRVGFARLQRYLESA